MLYHPLTIGNVRLEGNLFLAPVAGYFDVVLRTICAGYGANLCFTELVSSEALTRGHSAEILLLRGKEQAASRFAIQIFGADPAVMAKALALLAPYKPDIVDINAGCPVLKVVKTGAGSALMRNPALFGSVVSAVVAASEQYLENVPVTVKIRSGWDHNSINFMEIGRVAVESGAKMVSLHPRARSDFYTGKSNWAHIADLAASLPVPVCGSGDLYSAEDAARMLSETACAALMFARGAMGKPGIFTDTRRLLQKYSEHSLESYAESKIDEEASVTIDDKLGDSLAIARRHLLGLAELIGEKQACLEMRKQFCAYTSGLRGGAALRARFVHCSSIAEYEAVLSAV